MPAKSGAQQRLMAMALHNPSKIHRANRGVLAMSKEDLRDFSKMGHNKKFMNKRGDHTSRIDHMYQGKKGGTACL